MTYLQLKYRIISSASFDLFIVMIQKPEGQIRTSGCEILFKK